MAACPPSCRGLQCCDACMSCARGLSSFVPCRTTTSARRGRRPAQQQHRPMQGQAPALQPVGHAPVVLMLQARRRCCKTLKLYGHVRLTRSGKLTFNVPYLSTVGGSSGVLVLDDGRSRGWRSLAWTRSPLCIPCPARTPRPGSPWRTHLRPTARE